MGVYVSQRRVPVLVGVGFRSLAAIMMMLMMSIVRVGMHVGQGAVRMGMAVFFSQHEPCGDEHEHYGSQERQGQGLAEQ